MLLLINKFMTKNKNTKNNVWFRAKMYGWGWYPISWQGWILTLLYLVGILQFAANANQLHSASDILMNFTIPFVIDTIFLLTICYAKGERPRWRWGK